MIPPGENYSPYILLLFLQKNYLNKQIATHRDYLEQHLTQHKWFAGSDFSAADIQMSFPIEAINSRGGLEGFPKLQNFLAQIHERPAYKQAIEKGGAYTLER